VPREGGLFERPFSGFVSSSGSMFGRRSIIDSIWTPGIGH